MDLNLVTFKLVILKLVRHIIGVQQTGHIMHRIQYWELVGQVVIEHVDEVHKRELVQDLKVLRLEQ